MRIVLSYVGPAGEGNSHYAYVARVNVETDEDAELAGQRFARLVDHLGEGMRQMQQALVDAESDADAADPDDA